MFSVVITNYNYAAYLTSSIESVLAQDFEDYELIVVDDCSTDHSREVIEGFSSRFSHVKSVFHTENRGHAGAFNSGILSSNSDYVIFLDADDVMHKNCLSSVLSFIQANTSFSLCHFYLRLVDSDGAPFGIYPYRLDAKTAKFKLRFTGRYNTCVTSGMVFSRSFLSAVYPIHQQDFSQGADGFLAAVAPFYGEVLKLDKVLCDYRRHDSNHSLFDKNVQNRSRWVMEHNNKRYFYINELNNRNGDVSRDYKYRDPVSIEALVKAYCWNDEVKHSFSDALAFRRKIVVFSLINLFLFGTKRDLLSFIFIFTPSFIYKFSSEIKLRKLFGLKQS